MIPFNNGLPPRKFFPCYEYEMNRILIWFSCGIASAVAAYKTLLKYGQLESVSHFPITVELLYCDTLAYEHPDNPRFMKEVSTWLNRPIKILKSTEYTDIYDVFERERFLRGPKGARCTTELKKRLRWDYERPGDLHIFGFTAEEEGRFARNKEENPDILTEFILENTSKQECMDIVKRTGIETPMMYKMGYPNNNCRGCVKAESVAYWTHIRQDWPEIFNKMAVLERKLNFALNRKGSGDNRKPLFLDQIPPGVKKMKKGLDFECGVLCSTPTKEK